MGKTKELAMEEQQKANQEAFRESPLGKAITELEGHVGNHLVAMLDAVGIGVTDEQRDEAMTHFIADSHASGTIQRLVWEQTDHEAKQRAAVETSKAEKAVKKAEKKEATKKNRSRGKTSMKKA